MAKKTKLMEKSARIPNIRESQFDETITQYLNEVESLNVEAARSLRFGQLMQALFGSQPGFIESYVSGAEKYIRVKQKDRVLKGRADNLFGNVVIEFEANIQKNRNEAEEQLHRYVAILWSQENKEKRNPYLCIATDGVRFITYSPSIDKPDQPDILPEHVHLEILEEVDCRKTEPTQIYFWLDRYFFRKEILHPTSQFIVSDFGLKSHAFQSISFGLLNIWQKIKKQNPFSVIYDSWEKYLRIVYGGEVAGDVLFIRHTYLATLAKLMSWIRISDLKNLDSDPQIVEMLDGHLFKNYGIENFIEEDFFSWLARGELKTTGISIVRQLFSILQNYNLRELSEDVFKSLYQELVDPETRHDLGEFYTPDWLAHRMVDKFLNENSKGTLLDPACGSGTFLYLSIREKRERLGNSAKTLDHILHAVCGLDIHPLAVIVAKTNYILGLGELLKKRTGSVTIPIYLADAIKLPERWAHTDTSEYHIMIGGKDVYLPNELLHNIKISDHAIELAKEFALLHKKSTISYEQFNDFLSVQHFSSGSENFKKKLYKITEIFKHFIDEDRDTIWAYILKNVYKPLFFENCFDFIIGNPPWIAFRYMEPAYQKFLKNQISVNYALLIKRGELITHMEVATLFLVRAADLYLKLGGQIAFVLPRSLFSADQHDRLRRGSFKLTKGVQKNLFWEEIWDCEKVKPLFNVPACVLFAEKKDRTSVTYPVKGEILTGKLTRKNVPLHEAQDVLKIEKVKYFLHTRGNRSYWAVGENVLSEKESYYKKRFFQGATIVPRSFWFVELEKSPIGFDPNLPPIMTSSNAIKSAKEDYKEINFKGSIEGKFLYHTLLSTNLLPFGNTDFSLLLLPIEITNKKYTLLDADAAAKKGFSQLSQWLNKAEKQWNKIRGEKAKQMNIYERIDRYHGLVKQNLTIGYKVIYNTSGTYLTATVIENKPVSYNFSGQKIKTNGFLADAKTYYCEFENKEESNYIVAVLNSPKINELIKPMQSRGLWGPRDIHKKVLELPIPRFDEDNKIHVRLAEIGEDCSKKVENWLASGGQGKIQSIGKLRSMVRNMLKEELKEINRLVEGILR